MKGIISFLFVLLAISIVFSYYSVFFRVKSTDDRIFSDLLLLEDRHARELEVKHVIYNTIRHAARDASARGLTADEITAEVGEQLAALVEMEGRILTQSRLHVSFWCGAPSSNELTHTVRRMQATNSTQICSGCSRPDGFTMRIVKEREPPELIRSCTPFLSANTIEETVTVVDPDARTVPPIPVNGPSAIGASVYDSSNNISSIVILPSSSKISWGVSNG